MLFIPLNSLCFPLMYFSIEFIIHGFTKLSIKILMKILGLFHTFFHMILFDAKTRFNIRLVESLFLMI